MLRERAAQSLSYLISNYEALKNSFVQLCGISREALHLAAGCALYLAASTVFRHRRHREAIALAVPAIAALLNELADQLELASKNSNQSLEEMLTDFALTVAAPTILYTRKYILKKINLYK